MADIKSGIKNKFKTPEGRYTLLSEKAYGSLPFNNLRSTKLSLARLDGSADDAGPWLIYNSGDFLYVCRHDSTKKEPARSLCFPTSSSKPSIPTCHAFAACKDGNDLLVGVSDGTVSILSLKVQLKLSANSTKPKIVETLAPEEDKENACCVAVAWVPRSEGGLFVAGFASGCIYVFKKSSVVGESTGKFLSLGSNKKDSSPMATWNIGGGGITDVAVSPDGTRVAASCRDGALRLMDIATGAVVGGMQSYFGALTCCSFSHDGKYLAAGGEDDMVVVYGLKEKCPIAHCEGHRSWVSCVRFDPWAQLGGSLPLPGLYRLASGGQDAQMCLWDVQSPSDGETPVSPKPGMRKTGSQASLQITGWQGAEHGSAASAANGTSSAAPSHARPATHNRTGSAAAAGSSPPPTICPSPLRADMVLTEPLMEHRLHLEPLSDILITEGLVYTADATGVVRTWQRPQKVA